MSLRVVLQHSSRHAHKQLRMLQSSYRLNGCCLHTSSKQQESFNIQDDKDFKTRVLKNKKPVLVDFHANWCGPCKLLNPRLDAAVADANDTVDLAKVDIDELVDLAMYYSVSSVPTVIAIKNGVKVDQFIGLQEAEVIEAMIAKVVN